MPFFIGPKLSFLNLMSGFPLMVDKGGMPVSNPIAAVNPDGSFDVIQPPHMGEQVQFSFCDAGRQGKEARGLGMPLAEYQLEAVVVYSCEVRKTLFGEDLVVDMAALESCPSSAGVFLPSVNDAQI